MPEFRYIGDEGKALLDSALKNPAQTFDGRFLYRTIYDKAAILLQTIIKNHPFLDGNKRMGLTATFVFLSLNNHFLHARRCQAVEMCLRIAGLGDPAEFREIKKWLRDNTIPLDQGQATTDRLNLWSQSPPDDPLTVTRLDEVLEFIEVIQSSLNTIIIERQISTPA